VATKVSKPAVAGKKKAAAKKPTVKKRTPGRAQAKPRSEPRAVSSDEGARNVKKDAKHRQIERKRDGTATYLGNGRVAIACQSSEIVPIAKYAQVTIGPIRIDWETNADMDVLADVDWQEGELTDEQQAVYDHVRGSIDAGMAIIEDVISEDRELVERSIRAHNAREKEKSEGS
jgi:hypothetical protein